ncbi:MAG: hypothetical protein MJ197_10075 [Bacteroidales bacterium]|nr:hypothetical protein [Bacteroidales bacterium]
MLEAKVNNMPEVPRKYVVARVVSNELWFWTTFNDREAAEQSARECSENAIVLEMVD